MAIYLFYVCRAGRPETFEALDLPNDAAALSLAPRLLAEHGSADGIEVMQGERAVGVLPRSAAAAIPPPRRLAAVLKAPTTA